MFFDPDERQPRDFAGNKLTFEGYMKQHRRWKGLPIDMLKKNESATHEYQRYLEVVEKEDKEREKFRLAEEKRLEEWAKAQQKKEVEAQKEKENEPTMLPVWGDAFRAAPNCILRSPLFGAVRESDREKKISNKKIVSSDGVTITYTGEELNQGDFDVWCGVIQLSRNKPREFSFTSTELLKTIGIPHSNGTANHMILYKRLHRLNETTLHVLFKGKRYNASLIDSITEDNLKKFTKNKLKRIAEDKLKKKRQDGVEGAEISAESETESEYMYAGIYQVKINEVFLDMFASNEWSSFEWSVRRKLSGKVLALWLHCYYSTHKNPFSLNVSTIYALCGSKDKQMRRFKYELKKAIEAVCDATGWEGGIDDTNKVFIKKNKKIAKIY